MFSKYAELIKNIFNGITSGKSTASFLDYLSVLGYSLGIMLVIFIALALMFLAIKLPMIIYSKLIKQRLPELDAIETEYIKNRSKENLTKYENIQKKIRNKKVCFWICIVFVYVPILIPTALVLMDLFVKVIA